MERRDVLAFKACTPERCVSRRYDTKFCSGRYWVMVCLMASLKVIVVVVVSMIILVISDSDNLIIAIFMHLQMKLEVELKFTNATRLLTKSISCNVKRLKF